MIDAGPPHWFFRRTKTVAPKVALAIVDALLAAVVIALAIFVLYLICMQLLLPGQSRYLMRC